MLKCKASILFFLIFTASVNATSFSIAEPKKISFFYYAGILKIEGFLKISENTFNINFKEPEKSKIILKIDLENSSAGFPLASLIMKGKKVLDTVNYPFGYFESKKIRKNGDIFIVNGFLTLKGKKKKTKIKIALINLKEDLINFDIEGSFNRNEFGADGYKNFVDKMIFLESKVQLLIEKS